MSDRNLSHARVVPFPDSKKGKSKKAGSRKGSLNQNREGSVRNIGGKVYVDFIYLDERVRECAGHPWNERNAKEVRAQMDKIIVAIRSGTFRFAEVFPDSKRKDYFAEKEFLKGKEVIELNEKDVWSMSSNFLLLEENSILADIGCHQFNKKLEKRGIDVIEVDVSELKKNGGGIRCMTLELFRE